MAAMHGSGGTRPLSAGLPLVVLGLAIASGCTAISGCMSSANQRSSRAPTTAQVSHVGQKLSVLGTSLWDDRNAVIAGDARQMAVAISGRQSRDTPVTVAAWHRGGDSQEWLQYPPLASGADVERIGIAITRRGPCVAIDDDRGISAQCISGTPETWVSMPSPPGRPAVLVDARQGPSKALDLLLQDGRHLRLVSLTSDRWVRRGGPLPVGIAALGRDPQRRTVTIEGRSGRTPRRTMYELVSGHWKLKARASGLAMGPNVSGGLRVAGETVSAVSEAPNEKRRKWGFKVVRAESSSAGTSQSTCWDKSVRTGSVQGVVARAGDSVWMARETHIPRRDHTFTTTIEAAKLAHCHQRPQQTWQGRSIGPGDLDIVRALGHTWLLSMTGRSRTNPALEARIEPLP
jgi:hypothetical protein